MTTVPRKSGRKDHATEVAQIETEVHTATETAMQARHLLPAILIIAGLTGCASTSLKKETFKSYSLGTVSTVSVGQTFLIDQSGSVETVKSWVGIINSPDGWKVEDRYSR